MNRPDQYFKTVAILLEAYKNENLYHTNWQSCACANLIAAHMGYKLRITFSKPGYVGAVWRYKGGVVESESWGKLLWASILVHPLILRLSWGKKKYRLEKKHLACTGYTRKELRRIVYAFDQGQDLRDSTVHVLDSLKRVLQTLKAIHKVDHFDVQENYRARFVAELKAVEQLPETYDIVQEYYDRERRNQQEILEQTGCQYGERLPFTLPAKKEKVITKSKMNELID